MLGEQIRVTGVAIQYAAACERESCGFTYMEFRQATKTRTFS